MNLSDDEKELIEEYRAQKSNEESDVPTHQEAVIEDLVQLGFNREALLEASEEALEALATDVVAEFDGWFHGSANTADFDSVSDTIDDVDMEVS